MGPECKHDCPYKRRARGTFDAHEKRPCEDRAVREGWEVEDAGLEDWNDEATSQGTPQSPEQEEARNRYSPANTLILTQ